MCHIEAHVENVSTCLILIKFLLRYSSTILQLTDNAYKDCFPKMNNKGYGVWQGVDIDFTYNYEILFAKPDLDNDGSSDNLTTAL